MFAANVRRRRKMPQLSFSTLFTANQLGVNPVSGWQYEYLPWPAQIIILMRSTTTGNRVTVYSGSETIQERSPVQAGGTIGVTPSGLTAPAISFLQAASVPAGGAGTFFMVRLRNPATSNVIAVVEKIVVYNLGAATDTVTLNHGAVATDLATVNTGISRFDGRGNQTGALIFSSTAAAIASFGGNKENFQLLTNARVELIATDIQEIPIVPGDAIQVQGSVANLNVNGASFWWRERFIEEAERT